MLPFFYSPGREVSRVLRWLHALQHQVFIGVLFAVLGALPPNPRPAGGLACGAIFKQQLFLLCTVCVCAVIRQT